LESKPGPLEYKHLKESQETDGMQECLQQWYSCWWWKCVKAEGNCVEGGIL